MLDWSLVPVCAKGARYFVRCGPTTKFNRGFVSKASVNQWFFGLQVSGHLDWRAGSTFRIRGVPCDLFVVNRKGEKC